MSKEGASRPRPGRLIDVLAGHEALSASQLEHIIQIHRERGGLLCEVLLTDNCLSEEELFYLLRRRLELPVAPEDRLRRLKLSADLKQRLPKALARSLLALPLELDAKKDLLRVAMVDPTDAEAIERLREAARVSTIQPRLARRSPLLAMIQQLYGEAGEVLLDEGRTPPAGSGNAPEVREPGPPTTRPPAAPGIEAKVQLDPSLERDIQAMQAETRVYSAVEVQRSEPPPLPRPVKGPARLVASDEDRVTPPITDQRAGRREVLGRSLLQPAVGQAPTRPAPSRATRAASVKAPAAKTASARGTQARSAASPPGFPPLPPVTELNPPPTASADAPIRPPIHGRRAVRAGAAPARPSREPPAGLDEPQTEELDLDALDMEHEVEVEDELLPPDELIPLTPMPTPMPTLTPAPPRIRTPLPDIQQMEELDSLLGELLGSVGLLVSMLGERVDPDGGGSREIGQLTRLLAREASQSELTVARLTLAAHLYSLDIALRREVGSPLPQDVTESFDPGRQTPGGLDPSLRQLGARVLGLDPSRPAGQGAALLRLVVQFLRLREESAGADTDLRTLAQLLRTGGADSMLVEALMRVLDASSKTLVRRERPVGIQILHEKQDKPVK